MESDGGLVLEMRECQVCARVCVHVRVGNTNISVCVSEGGVGVEEGVIFQYI